MKRARVTEELAYGNALDRLTGAGKPRQVARQDKREVQPPTTMIKLSVFLNQEEYSYLENLASTAKFSGGKCQANLVRGIACGVYDVAATRFGW